jgi:hypothetical protein
MSQYPQEPQQPGDAQPPPPPQYPYDYGYDYAPPLPQTKWPKVIGIIAIVLASLALFGGLCGIVQQVAGDFWPTPDSDPFELPPWWETYGLVNQLVGFAVAAVLLAGGIMLVRRRPAARPLLLGYSAFVIILTVANGFLTYLLIAQLTADGAPQELVRTMSVAVVIGSILGLAWPMFLIIWLMRRPIRDEVATWQ